MTRKPPSRSSRDEHESGRADEQPDHHAAGHQAIRPGASAGPSEGQSMYQVGSVAPRCTAALSRGSLAIRKAG